MLVLHLAILLIFGPVSAEVSNNTQQRRVIVRYSARAREAVHQHYQSLLSQGVSIQDLAADDLAVLSGPANTVITEALKLPGVKSIEEDIILKAHVC
jgi:hypothetical protein